MNYFRVGFALRKNGRAKKERIFSKILKDNTGKQVSKMRILQRKRAPRNDLPFPCMPRKLKNLDRNE